jgi:lipopolysaccharide/colanic/teichoic acid biosynthesis glycosyltransferase
VESEIPTLCEGHPLKDSFYIRCGKRGFDAVASLIGLLVLSPVFLLIAIAVYLDSPGSPFFLQNRVGLMGKTFRIIKFRTMRAAAAENVGVLITGSGDSRITRVGKGLRKPKTDELPQLLNVLRGEMSLVGPRPEVLKYTELYTPEQLRVFDMRPGITGPAAIAYADEEEILSRQLDRERYYVAVLVPAKLEIDLSYCRNISFRVDVALILGTFGRLLGKQSPATSTKSSSAARGIQESS